MERFKGVMYRTYIFKLWLSTMVAVPIVFVPLITFFDSEMLDQYPAVQMIFVMIFIGFIISIPALLCVNLLFLLVENRFKSPTALKRAIIIFSILVLIGSFIFFFYGSFDQKEFNLMLTLASLYTFFIMFFGFIYKLERKS
jgi:hypothetical protein